MADYDDDFGGFGAGGSDDDDDIARFERMCAERARAEGLLPHEAPAAHEASDEDEGYDGETRQVRIASPGVGGDEWRERCSILQDKLGRREAELVQVKTDLEMLKSDGVGANDPSDALKSRLIELTKQNRRLKVTNESQKTKIQQLEAEVRKPKDLARRDAEEAAMQNNHQALLGDGFEEWKKKYLTASNQLQDVRQQAQELRTMVAKHKKVLFKELGTEDAVEKALAVADDPAAASWKGRAAQISQLQRQLRELREQLRNGGGGGVDDESTLDLGSVPAGSSTPSRPRRTDAVGEREREAIAQAAAKRREEFDKLQEEAERLRNENADAKRKREALKSRSSLLETQLRELKAHVQTLLRKSDDDDALVNVLRRQLGRTGHSEDGVEGREFVVDSAAVEELQQENADLRTQLERQAQIVLQLRQKSMAAAVESGSQRLGPQAGMSERQLLERVRYLEAENARYTEQARLIRERTGEDTGGSSYGRPISSESVPTRREKQRQSGERLNTGDREQQYSAHRYRIEESSPSCRSSRSSSRGPGVAGLGSSAGFALGVAG